MKGIFEQSPGFTRLCLLALVVFFCATVAVGIPVIYSTLSGINNSPENLRMLFLTQNLILFVFSPLIAQYFLWKAPLKEALGLYTPQVSLLLPGIAAIIFASPMIDALSAWNQGLHFPESMIAIEQWMIDSERQAAQMTRQMLEVSSWSSFLMNILVIAILAGIGEELLFRGVLQRIFIEWTKSIHIGVLLTALIFSAIHFQFFGFIPRFVLGALLGYLFVWSKSLWVPILAHTLNNALVIILTPTDFNKGSKWIEAVANTDNSPWLTTLSTLLVALCMYAVWKLSRKKRIEPRY